MPYVEGETFRERLDGEKQLSVEEAVRIATAVASTWTSRTGREWSERLARHDR
jgi:hypothetical protein